MGLCPTSLYVFCRLGEVIRVHSSGCPVGGGGGGGGALITIVVRALHSRQ